MERAASRERSVHGLHDALVAKGVVMARHQAACPHAGRPEGEVLGDGGLCVHSVNKNSVHKPAAELRLDHVRAPGNNQMRPCAEPLPQLLPCDPQHLRSSEALSEAVHARVGVALEWVHANPLQGGVPWPRMILTRRPR